MKLPDFWGEASLKSKTPRILNLSGENRFSILELLELLISGDIVPDFEKLPVPTPVHPLFSAIALLISLYRFSSSFFKHCLFFVFFTDVLCSFMGRLFPVRELIKSNGYVAHFWSLFYNSFDKSS